MKKASVLRLSISAILLAAVGYGATLHASDRVPSVAAQPALTAARHAATEDVDLIGVIGDVLVDGCKTGDGSCAKAWQDLGQLAGKDSL